MSVTNLALLFVAAFLGGSLNAVAGGGSFITFPALLMSGVASISANATSAVALWPGAVASCLGYRRELNAERALLVRLAPVSMVGGLLGGLLLLWSPEPLFSQAIPFLLLVAAVVFTFGDALRKRLGEGEPASQMVVMGAQAAVSVYGGYFGGGMGLMMLAIFALAGMTDMHRMNALKSAFWVLVNGVAVVTFIIAGKVEWGPAAVMVAGGMLGGFAGAAMARRLDSARIRRVVVGYAWVLTAYFFYQTFVG